MKHIILAAALLSFSAPAFATDPAPRVFGATFATSYSGAIITGHGTSTAQVEMGNASYGRAQISHNLQQSKSGSDSYGIGKSTGHGAFGGVSAGTAGAVTFGHFGRF